MRLKNILVLALVMMLVAFLDSCGKTALNYTGSKIATKEDFSTGVIYTYTYNDDGSVNSITQTASPSYTNSYFTYLHDTILQENKEPGTGVFLNGMCYLTNSIGLADSAFGLKQLQNNTWSYTYDANYYPMQINYYTYNKLYAVDQYNIVGKNINSIEHFDSTGHTHHWDYYAYYASNTNTLGNQAIGENYLGVQNANLIEYDIIITPVGSDLDTTDIIKYNYRYDTSGRPDTVATYHRNGQMIDSAIYTYTD